MEFFSAASFSDYNDRMLGQKIAELRKRKGMSQELLAENSRLSLRTIQRIESGASDPRPYTLKVIADTLGVQIDEISIDSQELHAREKADWTAINFINLSGLAVLIFPLLNILLPLMVWKRKRQLPLANTMGRKIISFQILWSISTLLILILYQLIQMAITGYAVIGRIPVVFVLYLILAGGNVAFIIRNAILIKKGDENAYSAIPSLL